MLSHQKKRAAADAAESESKRAAPHDGEWLKPRPIQRPNWLHSEWKVDRPSPPPPLRLLADPLAPEWTVPALPVVIIDISHIRSASPEVLRRDFAGVGAITLAASIASLRTLVGERRWEVENMLRNMHELLGQDDPLGDLARRIADDLYDEDHDDPVDHAIVEKTGADFLRQYLRDRGLDELDPLPVEGFAHLKELAEYWNWKRSGLDPHLYWDKMLVCCLDAVAPHKTAVGCLMLRTSFDSWQRPSFMFDYLVACPWLSRRLASGDRLGVADSLLAHLYLELVRAKRDTLYVEILAKTKFALRLYRSLPFVRKPHFFNDEPLLQPTDQRLVSPTAHLTTSAS